MSLSESCVNSNASTLVLGIIIAALLLPSPYVYVL